MNENSIEALRLEIKGFKEELKLWQELIQRHMFSYNATNDKWLSLNDLIVYLPDKTAKATIYGWVSQGIIPYHKYGKKLTFLKSEIDSWLLNNTYEIIHEPVSKKKIQQFR